MQQSETEQPTDKIIQEIRAELARAAEDFARAMHIPLPTGHDASCLPFCSDPGLHAYSAIARTLHDVSALQEALAKGTLRSGAVINSTTLHAMLVATSAAPSAGAAVPESARPSLRVGRARRGAR